MTPYAKMKLVPMQSQAKDVTLMKIPEKIPKKIVKKKKMKWVKL